MSSVIEKKVLSQLLAECYHDATRKDGLIDFVTQIRPRENDYKGKYSISQKDLAHLFSETVWKEAKHAG